MNPKMLQEEEKKLEQKLADVKVVTEAPIRYLQFVELHGTALDEKFNEIFNIKLPN